MDLKYIHLLLKTSAVCAKCNRMLAWCKTSFLGEAKAAGYVAFDVNS